MVECRQLTAYISAQHQRKLATLASQCSGLAAEPEGVARHVINSERSCLQTCEPLYAHSNCLIVESVSKPCIFLCEFVYINYYTIFFYSNHIIRAKRSTWFWKSLVQTLRCHIFTKLLRHAKGNDLHYKRIERASILNCLRIRNASSVLTAFL